MNINQIKYFVSVFDHGSLSAAAKEQCVTVQAVSKALADLERELQSDLFVRQSRGVSPTLFGKRFYAKAAPVLRMFSELERFAHTYQASSALALNVALCVPAFHGSERARTSIAAFIGRNLGVSTTVAIETLARGTDGLRTGEYDAFFTVGAYEHPDVECASVGTVSPGVIMTADHPLAHRRIVSLDDMMPYPVLVPRAFQPISEAVEKAYCQSGLDLRFECETNEEFDAFLSQEQGLAFAAGISALGEMHPRTVLRLISPKDAVAVPICLVSPKVGKSNACCVFERWMARELVVMGGGNPIGRLAAVAVAPAPAAGGAVAGVPGSGNLTSSAHPADSVRPVGSVGPAQSAGFAPSPAESGGGGVAETEVVIEG